MGGSGPNNYTTIHQAIENATDGDTIYVYAGTYSEHLTINKQLTLKGEEKEITIIDGGGSGNVIKSTADHVKITGFTLQNGGIGIYLVNAINQTITNNILENNWEGIGLLNVDNAIISHNKIQNNWFEGINPVSSQNLIIKRNRISGHLQGIFLSQTTTSLIKENYINSNTRGIEVRASSHNNQFFHNNIKTSTEENAVDECTNQWDNGYPSGGNYWDDYNGYDHDGDGIGDIPYSIEGGTNKDYYPFMEPLTWNDPPHKPNNPNPNHEETGVSINPFLSVTVVDPNNDLMTVSFYNASDDTLIGVQTNVESGSHPSIQWTNLSNLTTYYWYVKVTDGQYINQSATWKFTTGNQTNQPPDTPHIDGAHRGQAGVIYAYTFYSNDPENQDVFVYVDWGDQTNSGWVGPYSSGEFINLTHSWNRGSYNIRAKSRDASGAESAWSPDFPITMPYLFSRSLWGSVPNCLLLLKQFISTIISYILLN